MVKFIIEDDKVKVVGRFPKRMSKKQALALSIEKWEMMVEYLEKHPATSHVWTDGAETCALCWKYLDGDLCYGCPVAEKTGFSGCESSPYYEYWEAHNNKDSLKYAKKELAFLKSLQE